MKDIEIHTLGCKINQYESASFLSSFEARGHRIVASGSNSDVIVINTCSVTNKAGAQSRHAIRKSLRDNPRAKIVITGCHAEVAAEQLKAMEEMQGRSACIVGNADKHLLVDAALADNHGVYSLHTPVNEQRHISPLPVRNFGGRTRAYLRIQDGCDSFCSYCIVPHTRGRSRSLGIDDVLRQAKIFAEEGYREIVVSGIHVGYYGADLADDIDIAGIMETLCHTTPRIRYRLSSIEPVEISDKLLAVMAENNNFMPHLHIPLQSGNDDILLRMGRRYSTSRFAEIVDLCNRRITDVAIGIDILAGFPGETDEQFSSTYSFLEDLDCTYLHVFPYSMRPGTPAAGFPDQVAASLKDQRVTLLRRLGEHKKQEYYTRFINQIRPVLVEGKRNAQGNLKGLSDNYIPLFFAGENSYHNTIVEVQLERMVDNTVEGSIIPTDHER
ncbi:MAG: tRNA (N(6)-L-threonylcarbamoyladenosine(37)-C(2))-methylthiotransferase MtaB [Desulfopila sp.]